MISANKSKYRLGSVRLDKFNYFRLKNAFARDKNPLLCSGIKNQKLLKIYFSIFDCFTEENEFIAIVREIVLYIYLY